MALLTREAIIDALGRLDAQLAARGVRAELFLPRAARGGCAVPMFCPRCYRTYDDPAHRYCPSDGAALLGRDGLVEPVGDRASEVPYLNRFTIRRGGG